MKRNLNKSHQIDVATMQSKSRNIDRQMRCVSFTKFRDAQ